MSRHADAMDLVALPGWTLCDGGTLQIDPADVTRSTILDPVSGRRLGGAALIENRRQLAHELRRRELRRRLAALCAALRAAIAIAWPARQHDLGSRH